MTADISAAVSALMLSQEDITELVQQKVFSDILPQDCQLPAIVFHVLTESADDCLTGSQGFEQATVQIEVYARSRPQSNVISLITRNSVTGYRGVIAGTDIRAVTQSTGGVQITDPPDDGSQRWQFRTIRDLLFTYYTEIS